MPEQKDMWTRIDLAARIMTPLVIFGLGIWFNIYQQSRDAVDKRIDRYMSYARILSSDKPIERTLAIQLFANEKDKYPNNIPDELLTIAVPQLLMVATSDLMLKLPRKLNHWLLYCR